MFDDQRAAVVATGHRAITLDLRLHGQSRPSGEAVTPQRLVADVVEVLRQLDVADPVLVGQSLGGNVAQEVVRVHPDRARALVVIGSACNTAPLSWVERRLLSVAAPSLRMIPARSLPGIMADAPATTEHGRAYAREAFARMPQRDFVEVWRATTGFLHPRPGYRTPLPLLLIRGERDRTGTIASGMPRWAHTEGVSEIVVAGAGHLANVDDPGAVNEVLLEFLARL